MKIVPVIIDYEPRIAALEADNRALQAAVLELLGRVEKAERACDLFRGALLMRARDLAGEIRKERHADAYAWNGHK